jgi:hypothetical protein
MGKVSVVSAVAGGCIASAVAGGVLGYLLHRHQSEARLNAEIQSIRDYYQHRLDEATVRSDEPAAEPADVALAANDVAGNANPAETGTGWVEPPVPVPDDVTPMLIGGGPYSEADVAPRFDPEPRGHVRLVKTPPSKVKRVYNISLDQFNEEHVQGDTEQYEKLSITYFDEDCILVDDKNDPLSDVVYYLGADPPDAFGVSSGNPNIMHVRNEKLAVDFEVTLDHRSYVGAVLNYGVPGTPRVKKMRGEM